ncbi:MAG: hypothetical protein JKY49_17895 [Cohaesibacteraceae bacterium]|nr:hypothetical protein [Cohaesibacteraceae bacterium]
MSLLLKKSLQFCLLLAGLFTSTASVKADAYAIITSDLHSTGTSSLGRLMGKVAKHSLKPGDHLVVYDGSKRQLVFEITIPMQNRFSQPKYRLQHLKKHFRPIARFQKSKRNVSNTDQNNDLVSLFRSFGDDVRAFYADQPMTVLLYGSALHHDPRQPDYSMREGAYPNDGHLSVDGFTSPYGVADRATSFQNTDIHFCIARDDYRNTRYQEKIERFWSLSIAGQGGRLASFTPDLASCVRRFINKSVPSRKFLLNAEQKRPVMLHPASAQAGTASSSPVAVAVGVNPNNAQPQTRLTATQGPRFLATDIPLNEMAALNTVGRQKVGIRWDCVCDLDLYVRYNNEKKSLYYGNKRSAYGSFFKDWTSSTDDAKSYEYVEFNKPIDARDLEIRVNFYSGAAQNGVTGAVRIWLDGQDGVWEIPFHLDAHNGNSGRTSSGGGHWVTINPLVVLNLEKV